LPGAKPTFSAGNPFQISTPNQGWQRLDYKLDPTTGYYIPSGTQGGSTAGTSIWDNLIQGGAIAGGAIATGAGLAGLGSTGPGAAAVGGSVTPIAGAAGTGAAASTGGALTADLVPGSFGGAAGAPLATASGDLTGMASALPAASTAPADVGAAGALVGPPADLAAGFVGPPAGLAGSLAGAPAAGTSGGLMDLLGGNTGTIGTGASAIGGATGLTGGSPGSGPLDVLNTSTGGVAGGPTGIQTSGVPGGGILDALNAGASGTGLGTSNLGSLLGQLFTPGGAGSLLNTQNLGGILASILGYNKSGQLANNLIGPYNTAMGNAQPAVNNLLSMMNPQNFYNSTVGQNLMAAKTRDINAVQAANGRGLVSQPGGLDATNLLNQYMAQQYTGALNAESNAVSPLLQAVNATYPGQVGGNIIGANQLNPLMQLFNTNGPMSGVATALNNVGNSALQTLWNGIG
jgi:hypothetical protein